MPHVFGTSSMKKYETLHTDLQMILDWGIKTCAVDFSLIEGHRPVSKQLEYYSKGRERQDDGSWKVVNKKQIITNVDGEKVKGKHNYIPSLAVDFCAHVPGKKQLAWDSVHLTYIAATLISIADRLFDEGMIQHKLRWGGNWDKDGDLADNTLYDRPHVELYRP